MNFLNVILLGGAAAFSIPLIIHILNKRKFKVVHWGAMHLLAPIMKKNNKRIQLEQLLLLLMRIAIPILLALCLARPVLTSMKAFQENEKLSTVFLLDNSFSMQDGTAAESNFTRAKGEVAKAMRDMRKGSDASVVLMGGQAGPLTDEPTTALDNVTKQLAGIAGNADPANVAGSLQQGVSELGRMAHAGREIVIMSDFQAGDWQDSEALTRRSAMDMISEMGVKPSVTLFQIEGGQRENACIQSIDVSALILGAGQPVSIRANLKNYGKTTYPDLMVFFKVDGEEKRTSQVTLGPGQEAQVLFSTVFEKPGDHTVEIMMDADALKADNSYVASFPVWDAVPVLLVDGDPAPDLDAETGFLQIALQPFGSARASLNDLITSQVIQAQQLNENEMKDKRLVILANVEKLQKNQLEQLEKFVSDGGGLIVFPGDRIDVKWYNDAFFKNGKGLLGRQYTGFAGRGYEQAGGVSETTRIVSEVYEHPAFAFFNDARNGKLSEPEFNTWLKMGFLGEGSENSGVRLARFDNGDLYALESTFGEGRVIQCAAPADADWGNLPTQPVYLPMMQRLVTYLASTVDPPRNLTAGRKLVAFLPAEMAEQDVAIKDPAGVDRVIKVKKEGARGVVEFEDTSAPGIYTVTDAERKQQFFAVNLDRGESDIEVLGEKEVALLAEEMEANLVKSYEEYTELDKERRFGVEIWKPILYALLALLFGELLFQQWIARRVL